MPAIKTTCPPTVKVGDVVVFANPIPNIDPKQPEHLELLGGDDDADARYTVTAIHPDGSMEFDREPPLDDIVVGVTQIIPIEDSTLIAACAEA